MALMNTFSTVSVDYSGIGSRKAQDRVRACMGSLGLDGQELTDFWEIFCGSNPEPAIPNRTLVMVDLARIWLHFRACDQPTWVASVRKTRPYFLAFIRTHNDRCSTPQIDDLMRSCDQRLLVCGELDETKQLIARIHEALTAFDPESLTDVRYSSATDSFWIQFGDGLSGSIGLADLGIRDLRNELVLESGIPGDRGSVMILTRTDGSPFEIDSASLRSVLDSEFHQRIRDAADASNATVGSRVRAARKAAGITQYELGRRAGLDQAVISNLETGKHDPRAETLRRLAQALNLSLAGLLVDTI